MTKRNRATAAQLLAMGIGVRINQTNREWMAEYTFGLDADGEPAIARMEIRPSHGGKVPPGGLTPSVIRRFKVGAVRQYARGMKDRAGDKRDEAHRLGRPKTYSHSFYKRVLARHKELVEAGDPHVSKTLSHELKGFSRTGMRSFLRRARKLGEFADSAQGSAHR